MKNHRFDGISFFSGLFITVIGVLFLIPSQPSDVIDAIGRIGNWFWPVLLVAIGVAVLVPTLVSARSGSTDEPKSQDD